MKQFIRKRAQSLLWVIDWAARWGINIGGFLILVLMLSIVYDVTMRYFFVRPTIWALDVSEYILVYSTFLAAAWILRQEGHVRITILTDRLSPRARMVIGIVTALIGAFVCLVLLWQSSVSVWDSFQRGLVPDRPLKVPEWATMAVIPLGSLLLSIYFVRRACALFAILKKGVQRRESAHLPALED